MCEHLMMRSFSLNENFALLAKQKDKEAAKGANFAGKWKAKMEDTLIYWQDASGIFNCHQVGGGCLWLVGFTEGKILELVRTCVFG